MLTKIAVGGLPPLVVVAGRLSVACILLIVVVMAIVRRPRIGLRVWMFFVPIAFFGNALPFSLISWGQRHIDSSVAGILMATMPLVTLGLAHYFVPGERVTRYRAVGFLLGFVGVIVLMGPNALMKLRDVPGQLLPMVAVLGGGVSYAIAAILARLRPASSAVWTAAATTFIATMMMLPVVLHNVEPPGLAAPSAAQLLAIALLGVFSTAIAGIVYFRLVSNAGPAFVSQLNYLIPMWAVVVGVMFLDETLQRNHLHALLLILGGILVTQLEQRRTTPAVRRSGEVTA